MLAIRYARSKFPSRDPPTEILPTPHSLRDGQQLALDGVPEL